MVNTVALGLLDLSKKSSFRRIVNEEVKKRFDEDDNVLLRTISRRLGSMQSINFVDSIKASVTKHLNKIQSEAHQSRNTTEYFAYTTTPLIEQAVNGFEYFDGTAFTQIYIPFIELQRDLNQIPIICLGLDDDDTAFGYKWNALTNKWEGIIVTEAIAMKTLVWVISVNETFEDVPSLQTYLDRQDSLELVNTPRNVTTHRHGHKGVRISGINLYFKNEHWISGRADIYFMAKHIEIGCPPHLALDNSTFISGLNAPIVKLGKNDLNKWHTIPISNVGTGYLAYMTSYGQNDRPFKPNTSIGFFIYEKDKRRKYTRTWVHSDAYSCGICPSYKNYYRSKDEPYGTVYCELWYGTATPVANNQEWVSGKYFLDEDLVRHQNDRPGGRIRLTAVLY